MEEKQVLLSSFAIWAGLNLGVGIYAGVKHYNQSNQLHEDQIVKGLMKLVTNNGKDYDVTFDKFPYYLREKVKILLTSAGYVHLKQHRLSKHTKNLSPVSRTILLSGPAVFEEFYQENLAKALAHYFESKLLILDIYNFAWKMQLKHGCPCASASGLFGSRSILSSKGIIRAPMTCTRRVCFDEKRLLDSLYKVLLSILETDSVILYIKNVENDFRQYPRMYNLFHELLNKLSGSVLILGSRIYDSEDKCVEVDEKLTMLFPCNIEIKPPQDESRLKIWKVQLEEAMTKTQLKHISQVLAENDIGCDDLNTIGHSDTMLLSNHIKEIAASAVFYQLMDNKNPEYRKGKLVISAESLCHVLSVFQKGESSDNDNKKTIKESQKGETSDNDNKKTTKESKKEVPPDNAFEKNIRRELISANEIGVTFSDIGALDDVKESLQEAVMLPLRRPDIFKGDGVLKPCKGVLLFGPPGTGKTMLAKAIANEAGASFINVSASTISSCWFGNGEKNVRALFSLAAKVSPTIIFIDEVDSLLGKRSDNDDKPMRRIKNEFMSHWDGLLSKPVEKVTVLAATNMPFGLDEAIIRRFQRRIMVGLPSAEKRETILKTLLAKEKHEDIDFKELSTMTEGYSGSDLKNLCTTAAYRPIKELMQQEKEKEMKKKKKEAEVEKSEDVSNTGDEEKSDQVIALRPLNMEDMRQAKEKVAASYATEGSNMKMLEQWNNLYGEGGSRKKEEQLSYFI